MAPKRANFGSEPIAILLADVILFVIKPRCDQRATAAVTITTAPVVAATTAATATAAAAGNTAAVAAIAAAAAAVGAPAGSDRWNNPKNKTKQKKHRNAFYWFGHSSPHRRPVRNKDRNAIQVFGNLDLAGQARRSGRVELPLSLPNEEQRPKKQIAKQQQKQNKVGRTND